MREEQVLGRLMAGRDGMDVTERERIFEAVYEAVSEESASKPQGSSTRPMLGAFVMAAGALFALTWTTLPTAEDPGLTARGGVRALHELELVCTTSGVVGPCARGALLSFRARSQRATHVALFARHDTTGALLWYSPRETSGGSAPLPAKDALLQVSVALGADHAPGRHTIYALFSEGSLTRADVRAQLRRDPKDPALVTRPLELP